MLLKKKKSEPEMRHEKIKVDKAACAFKIWALLNDREVTKNPKNNMAALTVLDGLF